MIDFTGLCLDKRIDTMELTTRQLAVLSLVYQGDNRLSVRDIASQLHLSKPAVTRTVDKLVKWDLTDKRNRKDDRRLIEVHQTKEGRALLAKFETCLAPREPARATTLRKTTA